MIDKYVLQYITDYLKLCKRCNKYDTCNNEKLCCICGDFFCTYCKTNLINIYGNYKSKYCIYCNKYFIEKKSNLH